MNEPISALPSSSLHSASREVLPLDTLLACIARLINAHIQIEIDDTTVLASIIAASKNAGEKNAASGWHAICRMPVKKWLELDKRPLRDRLADHARLSDSTFQMEFFIDTPICERLLYLAAQFARNAVSLDDPFMGLALINFGLGFLKAKVTKGLQTELEIRYRELVTKRAASAAAPPKCPHKPRK